MIPTKLFIVTPQMLGHGSRMSVVLELRRRRLPALPFADRLCDWLRLDTALQWAHAAGFEGLPYLGGERPQRKYQPPKAAPPKKRTGRKKRTRSGPSIRAMGLSF